jgi:hypothetical protein
LFKIPRVKEILGKRCAGFTPKNDVKIECIPYVDQNKGKQKSDLVQKRKDKFDKKVEEKIAEQKMMEDQKLVVKMEK